MNDTYNLEDLKKELILALDEQREELGEYLEEKTDALRDDLDTIIFYNDDALEQIVAEKLNTDCIQAQEWIIENASELRDLQHDLMTELCEKWLGDK